MALQMTHLAVAYRIADFLNVKYNFAEYILGSIAPDSVWFSDSFLEKKIHSHCFENCGPWGDTQDYDMWAANIKNFWKKYVVDEKDAQMKAFLTGMCVHTLTDYWYDLMVWSELKKKSIPPMTFDEFKKVYYPEAQKLDEWLLQNFSGAKDIVELLGASKEIDFEDFVWADNQCAMKKQLLETNFKVEGVVDVSDNKIFALDMMKSFVDEAPEKIFEQIKEFTR